MLMFKVRCVLFTIFSLQQLVDDVAEVLHFRASRDGEWDIIYNIPKKKEKSMSSVCYELPPSHTHIYLILNKFIYHISFRRTCRQI